jgi:uncharacterized protein
MFEWDTAKAAANLAKHGVRFDVAARVFDDPWRMERDVSRERDREVRHKVVGLVDGRLLAVVFTVRKGAARRIISARRTNTKEERQYADHS